MRFSEFKCKEVINLRDCQKLGKVSDLEFDPCSGCIRKIIVPDKARWCDFFSSDKEFVIDFKEIQQIGDDIIIVDICVNR